MTAIDVGLAKQIVNQVHRSNQPNNIWAILISPEDYDRNFGTITRERLGEVQFRGIRVYPSHLSTLLTGPLLVMRHRDD